MKSLYRTIDKSIIHKWLKEEGFTRYKLCLHFDKTHMTIDRYMREPERLTMEQVKILSDLTGVDANFIMELIYERT